MPGAEEMADDISRTEQTQRAEINDHVLEAAAEGFEEIEETKESKVLKEAESVPEPEEMINISPEEDALQAKETLQDMTAGIVACMVLLGAVGGMIAGNSRLTYLLGLLLGGGTAGLMLWHMYVTIDRALDMDSETAVKYTKKCAMFRILLAAAAFAVSAFLPDIFHIFGVLAGVLCLKFSAYLQPLTHKALKNFRKGR